MIQLDRVLEIFVVLTEKLDYLQHLGIDIVWLQPVYVSPQHDNGYDVADYYRINPDYGTMEDFDELLERSEGS